MHSLLPGRNAAVAVALVALLAGSACTKAKRDEGATPTGDDPGSLRLISSLEAFSECDDLLDYLRTEGAKIVGPYGFGGGIRALSGPFAVGSTAQEARGSATGDKVANAAPEPATASDEKAAGVDFSDTNVQEEGVDEPDLVKTDGKRLVTIAGGQLRVVDLTGPSPVLLSSTAVGQQFGAGELFLTGDRVLVVRPADAGFVEGPAVKGAPSGIAADEAFAQSIPRTLLSVIDIADAKNPQLVAELTVDGSLVAARMVDKAVRLVVRSGTPGLAFTNPSNSPASVAVATESNRKVIENSTLDDWMPGFTYTEPGNKAASVEGRLADCNEVSRPERFSGLDMVSVVSIEASDPRPGPAATVLGAGELVYASPANLYVTSAEYVPVTIQEQAAPDDAVPEPDQRVSEPAIRAPSTISTSVHKFDISDKVKTRYVASGKVEGRLLNQFSMSEYKGDLRVASTSDDQAESSVTVLRQDGEVLKQIGRVAGLGKNERIFAVRFLADRGYVVTFRQTDPLYVIDLSDAEHPAVRGELKIPGYSAYLHPIGDHRLLGVGQDATEQGRVQGTQLSLFDVSDPANPKQVAKAVLPTAHSEAEFDHHAFLYWAKTGLTMLPVQSFGGDIGVRPEPAQPTDGSGVANSPPILREQFLGAVGFTVSESAVKELGRVEHRGGMQIRRSLVVGDRVLTMSDGGLLSSDLSTLAERGWLQF